MTNEPKAGGSLDPEMLAAYLDKRLPPEARATVEAQLARDPDSYELLVELIHANEALKGETPAEDEAAEPSDRAEPQGRTGAVVPMVPKPKRTGGWLIAGGVLAAAAALALVVWLQPELWQRLRGGSPVDPLMAKLVEAVGEERYIEARLTGGFKYGLVRDVTRGPVGSNLALVAAAGELQKRARNSADTRNQHDWGIAQIAIGQYEGAATTLNGIIEGGTQDARVYSDAAAAALALAAAGNTEQLPIAMDFATRAVQLDAQLPEASFNRALALERLSLVVEAIDEWRRFVTIESSAAWRDEAQRHLATLEGQSSRDELAPFPSTLLGLAAFSAIELQSRIREDAAGVRAALEGSLLVDAVRGVSTPEELPESFQQGLVLANAFRDLTGDALPSQIWQHAVRTPRPASIGDGIEAYLAGRALLRTNAVSAAEAEFRRGHAMLLAAGSPGAALPELFLAHAAFYLGRTTDASERLRPLVRSFVANDYLSLSIRGFYLQGLCELRFGQHASVIAAERQAAALAQRVGDRMMEIVARSEIADAFDRLALTADAWKERVKVLGLAAALGDRNVNHVTLGGASRSAATHGQLHAARDFAGAMLGNAQQWGNAAAEAEARLRLADAAHRAKDNREAASLLEHASRLLDGMPDALADGSRVDVEMLRAAVQLESSPGEARAASDRAFEILAKRESPFRLARAKWLRGQALVDTQPDLARQEFLDGLKAAQSAPSAVDPFGRSLAEQRSALLRALVRLPAGTRGREEDLGDVVAVLTGRLGAPVLESVRALLQPGDMLLVLIALDDELVRWRVTPGETSRSIAAVTRADLSRQVAAYALSLSNAASGDWSALGRALSQLLLEPAAGQVPGRLLLVTDIEIAPVPFSTLTIPGRTGLLADTTEVLVLATHGRTAAATSRGAGRVLVMGDPAIDSADAVLPRLSGAMAEAREVAALYPEATAALGPEATKATYLRMAPQADIIHFAGHALGNRVDPAMSRLLLAGSNGDLTAGEVLAVRLRARLVVLGACEGALATRAGDSPVYGLAQAFLNAGAAAVVASRWKVADNASRELLVRFHRQIATGVAPATALRFAQAALRGEPAYRHPYYWAGFAVYVGTDLLGAAV